MNPRWLWSIVALLCLLGLDAILVLAAWAVYDKHDKEGFASVFAIAVLLNGAVVAILIAILTTGLSIISDIRAQREAEAHKRTELFRRMRDAHLRVALAQQILRAKVDGKTYDEQMRVLLRVVKDMGEIREEVRVSGRLYADVDRRLIMKGIVLIITYLQKGVSEDVTWSPPGSGRRRVTRPEEKENSWVVELVANHDASRFRHNRSLNPGAGDWEPRDGCQPSTMPDWSKANSSCVPTSTGPHPWRLPRCARGSHRDIATRKAAKRLERTRLGTR